MAIEGFISLWIPTHFCQQDEFYEFKIDTSHCQSYTEINIRKHEFGAENLWRRLAPKNGKSRNTIKRMSFVLSFDAKLGNKGFLMVRDAPDFLLFSMKKQAKKSRWDSPARSPQGSCTGSLQSFNEWLC